MLLFPTFDETVVFPYISESKQISMEWRQREGSTSVKAKTQHSHGKMLATVYLIQRSFALRFSSRTYSVNAACCYHLLDKIKFTQRLHDYARPHRLTKLDEKMRIYYRAHCSPPPTVQTLREALLRSYTISYCHNHLYFTIAGLGNYIGKNVFQSGNYVENLFCNLKKSPS